MKCRTYLFELISMKIHYNINELKFLIMIKDDVMGRPV
jgi:hypothetical protein